METSDEDLVRRSAEGDRGAFVQLVRRHEQPLANLIRYQIGNLDDAEDILQETLVAAWSGLRLLRDPDKFRREYCHRCDDMPQDESKPLTIDGVTLFQFDEDLGGIAVGIEEG